MAKNENTTSFGFGKSALLVLLLCMMAVVVQAQGKIYTYDDAKQDASITLPVFHLYEGEGLKPVEYFPWLRSLSDEERWLLHNYRKPADAQDDESVFISFVVESNGKLSNIQVQGWEEASSKKTAKVLPSVKREVIRLMKAMHKWTPAKKNGKAIRCGYEFHFTLREYALEVKRNEGTYSLLDDEDRVYSSPDEMPEFPGGHEALFKWISENVKPQDQMGRCLVQFVVEKNGSLSNPKIVKSVSPQLDAETLRLVKAMPKWTPGKKDGKPVRVEFLLPIIFK